MNTKTAKYKPPENEQELLLAWIRRTREAQLGHYEMARILSRYSYWLGIPVIGISAVVGVSAFSSIATAVIPDIAKIFVGSASIVVGVLSSLQTFFKFSERSDHHKNAAAHYGVRRRKLEHFYASALQGEKLKKDILEELREEIDALAVTSPHVPSHIFPRIQANAHFVEGSKKDSQELRTTPPSASVATNELMSAE